MDLQNEIELFLQGRRLVDPQLATRRVDVGVWQRALFGVLVIIGNPQPCSAAKTKAAPTSFDCRGEVGHATADLRYLPNGKLIALSSRWAGAVPDHPTSRILFVYFISQRDPDSKPLKLDKTDGYFSFSPAVLNKYNFKPDKFRLVVSPPLQNEEDARDVAQIKSLWRDASGDADIKASLLLPLLDRFNTTYLTLEREDGSIAESFELPSAYLIDAMRDIDSSVEAAKRRAATMTECSAVDTDPYGRDIFL